MSDKPMTFEEWHGRLFRPSCAPNCQHKEWERIAWDAAVQAERERLTAPMKCGHPWACFIGGHFFEAMKQCDEPYDVYKCEICRRQMHSHRDTYPTSYYQNEFCTACARAAEDLSNAQADHRRMADEQIEHWTAITDGLRRQIAEVESDNAALREALKRHQSNHCMNPDGSHATAVCWCGNECDCIVQHRGGYVAACPVHKPAEPKEKPDWWSEQRFEHQFRQDIQERHSEESQAWRIKIWVAGQMAMVEELSKLAAGWRDYADHCPNLPRRVGPSELLTGETEGTYKCADELEALLAPVYGQTGEWLNRVRGGVKP